MKTATVVIKTIWGIIVFGWLVLISSELAANVSQAQSAMQASQLYNEATTTILGIIAFTLILNFVDSSSDAYKKDIQQQVKYLAECAHYNSEILSRIEQQIKNSTTSNTINPRAATEDEPINSTVSFKSDQPSSLSSNSQICPKCHAPMLVRTASKGEYKGKQFYVCSNFPKCEEILPVQ